MGSALSAAAAAALQSERVQHRVLRQPPRDRLRHHCRLRRAPREHLHRIAPRGGLAADTAGTRGGGSRSAGVRGGDVRVAGGDLGRCRGGLGAAGVLEARAVGADERADLLLKYLQTSRTGVRTAPDTELRCVGLSSLCGACTGRPFGQGNERVDTSCCNGRKVLDQYNGRLAAGSRLAYRS